MKETLEKYEETVKKATKIRPLSAKGWASGVPKESGVYVIWEADIPIYVGETSSLKLRMSDLARPVNPSFSKKVAEMLSLTLSLLRQWLPVTVCHMLKLPLEGKR